jgi:hypothetical protein
MMVNASLARRFGVAESTIRHIRSGKRRHGEDSYRRECSPADPLLLVLPFKVHPDSDQNVVFEIELVRRES